MEQQQHLKEYMLYTESEVNMMKKYVFAKRTMYVFKRESGPFDEETIMSIDPRFISEGRVVCINDSKQEMSETVKAKIEEVIEDYKDDGKRNFSNNDKKKSPGRKSNKKKGKK